MNTLQILKDARALITPREAWTKGAFARDKYGCPTGTNTDAVCFCSMGAIIQSSVLYGDNEGYAEAGKAMRKAIGGSIPGYNDTHSHEEVLAMFDVAIASCV